MRRSTWLNSGWDKFFTSTCASGHPSVHFPVVWNLVQRGADLGRRFFFGRRGSWILGQFLVPGARSLNRLRKSVPLGTIHSACGLLLMCSSEWCRSGGPFLAIGVVGAALVFAFFAGVVELSPRPREMRLAGSETAREVPDSSFPIRSTAWSRRKFGVPSISAAPSSRRDTLRKKVYRVLSTL